MPTLEPLKIWNVRFRVYTLTDELLWRGTVEIPARDDRQAEAAAIAYIEEYPPLDFNRAFYVQAEALESWEEYIQ